MSQRRVKQQQQSVVNPPAAEVSVERNVAVAITYSSSPERGGSSAAAVGVGSQPQPSQIVSVHKRAATTSVRKTAANTVAASTSSTTSTAKTAATATKRAGASTNPIESDPSQRSQKRSVTAALLLAAAQNSTTAPVVTTLPEEDAAAAANTTATTKTSTGRAPKRARASNTTTNTATDDVVVAPPTPEPPLAHPPAPARIRIHGAKSILFDTMPNNLFYAAATFGRGALLMTQRKAKDIIEVESASDEDETAEQTKKRAKARTVKRRVYEKSMLLLPGADGSVVVEDGATYNVITLAVNPNAVEAAAAAKRRLRQQQRSGGGGGRALLRVNQMDGAANGALGVQALKEEFEDDADAALLKQEPVE